MARVRKNFAEKLSTLILATREDKPYGVIYHSNRHKKVNGNMEAFFQNSTAGVSNELWFNFSLIWNYDSYIWFIYMIYIFFERKFDKNLYASKNFEIRLRKFLFLQISRKCVGGKFFWLKIWNQHKISHRMIYIDIRFALNFIAFWKNNSLYAYAFREDIKNLHVYESYIWVKISN